MTAMCVGCFSQLSEHCAHINVQANRVSELTDWDRTENLMSSWNTAKVGVKNQSINRSDVAWKIFLHGQN